MVINLTNLTSATNFYGLVSYSNDVTNGIMGMGMIIVTFIILVMMFLNRWGPEKAILASSYICLTLSIMMRSIDLVNVEFILGFGVLTGLMSFYVFIKNR